MTKLVAESAKSTSNPEAPAPPTRESSQVGWSFLRSRRWIGYYALFLVFAISCVLLGNWQFERRAEARAEIERIDSNYSATPVPLADALPDLGSYDEDDDKWQSVSVTGEYLADVFLARSRPGASGVGSDLIQGFRTTAGTVIFIDRGWVDIDGISEVETDESVLPRGPSGPVSLEARLRGSEAEIAGKEASGNTVASIELTQLSRLAGVTGEAYIGAYGMLLSETPEGEHGALPPKPERDEGPHLSYALQWYVFILIAASGLVYAARQEFRGLNSGSRAVNDQDVRRADRKRRRGPSDADEEDALLDD